MPDNFTKQTLEKLTYFPCYVNWVKNLTKES